MNKSRYSQRLTIDLEFKDDGVLLTIDTHTEPDGTLEKMCSTNGEIVEGIVTALAAAKIFPQALADLICADIRAGVTGRRNV